MYALSVDTIRNSNEPDADCIRCGHCIEICPEQAISMYWFNTNRKVMNIFISLAITTVLAWSTWFIVIMADKIFSLL
jgi:polyferredoxin